MNQTPTNKNDKRKKHGLSSGSLPNIPNRPKSLFNFLRKQQPKQPLLQDSGNDSDSDETVIIDDTYGPEETSGILNMKLTDVNSTPPNNKISYSVPDTELLTPGGDNKMYYYNKNNELVPLTSNIDHRDIDVYYENGYKIPKKKSLPERGFINNVINNDINNDTNGGKRRRKTLRKTKRKPRKTRRNKRRHTRKYK